MTLDHFDSCCTVQKRYYKNSVKCQDTGLSLQKNKHLFKANMHILLGRVSTGEMMENSDFAFRNFQVPFPASSGKLGKFSTSPGELEKKIFKGIQFSREEENNSVSFLGILICRDHNSKLETQVYQ